MPWLHFFSVPESETSPNRGARVHPGRAPLLQAGEKGWVWVARRFRVHPPPRLPGGRSLFPDLVHSAARLKGRALPKSHEAIGTAICLSCVARSLLSALLSRTDAGRATLESPLSFRVSRFRVQGLHCFRFLVSGHALRRADSAAAIMNLSRRAWLGR